MWLQSNGRRRQTLELIQTVLNDVFTGGSIIPKNVKFNKKINFEEAKLGI
jgi:hypothetical protein